MINYENENNIKLHFVCDRCKEMTSTDELNELNLDGTDDFYTMWLCNKCNEIMSSDYYSPEQVDEMFK